MIEVNVHGSEKSIYCPREGVTIYYSYAEPVAFRHPEIGMVVTEEYFSVTTSKHISGIPGISRATELPRDLFQRLLGTLEIVSQPIPYELRREMKEVKEKKCN